MQLSLSTLIIIVTLMASIVISENQKEIQVEKIETRDSVDKMDENESRDEILSPNELYSNGNGGNCRKKRRVEKNGKNRTSGILVNRKAPSAQDLAEKLAEAELESPRMRETFKKLTDIHPPRSKSSQRINPSGISPSRFKSPRKRKKKRHKGRRGRHFGGKKWPDSRQRLARQIFNLTRKIPPGDSKYRPEQSIRYPPVEPLGTFTNDPQFQRTPYNNLNPGLHYPGVDDFDTNLQNSMLDENLPANYPPSYSPIEDQIDNSRMSNSILDNVPDFDVPNDQMPDTMNNYLDDQLQSTGNSGDSSFQNNYPNLDEPRENQFFDRINDNRRPKYRIFRGPNPSSRKSNNYHGNGPNKKRKNFGKRVPHTNAKDRSVSRDSKTSKNGERNRVLKSPSTEAFSESTTDSTNNSTSEKSSNESSTKSTITSISTTTKNVSPTTTNGKNVKARNASKKEKLIGENSENGISLTDIEDKDVTNNSAIVNETREVAGHILNKIIEELEDLKLERNKNDRLEGLPCKLSGSWVTTQAGVRIDLLVKNRRVNVSMANLNLPVGIMRKGLLNHSWSMTGYAPFRRGGPFSLVATDNHTKTLAVFVGACRVCQGIDTIEGVWSIGREPRDCRDFQMSTSIHNDIFRKTQLLTALKEKQLAMSKNAKSTIASSSTKEDYSDSENTELP